MTLLFVFGTCETLVAQLATPFDTADALWLFDTADSGDVAVPADIVDASGNGHAANAIFNAQGASLSWTTSVPSVGPGGNPTLGSVGRGLEFQPLVLEVDPGGPGTSDRVTNAGYRVDGFTVSGSATFITRLRWDGTVADSGMTWLYNNGLGGGGTGWMFGIRPSSGAARPWIFRSGGEALSNNNFEILEDTWYDIAVVMHTLGDMDPGNDTVTFYQVEDGGMLQVDSFAQPVAMNANANTFIGSESLGVGTGNERKAFDGTLDYIAVWDRALSPSEIQAALLIPEPSSLVLGGFALVALVAATRRRRR